MSKVCNSSEVLEDAMKQLDASVTKLSDMQRELLSEMNSVSDGWCDENYARCAEAVNQSAREIASSMCRMSELWEFIRELMKVVQEMESHRL